MQAGNQIVANLAGIAHQYSTLPTTLSASTMLGSPSDTAPAAGSPSASSPAAGSAGKGTLSAALAADIAKGLDQASLAPSSLPAALPDMAGILAIQGAHLDTLRTIGSDAAVVVDRISEWGRSLASPGVDDDPEASHAQMCTTIESMRADALARIATAHAQFETASQQMASSLEAAPVTIDQAVATLLDPLGIAAISLEAARTGSGSASAGDDPIMADSAAGSGDQASTLQARLATASSTLEQTGSTIEALLAKALAPLDALEAKLSGSTAGVQTAIDAVQSLVEAICDVLAGLNEQAEQVKATLVSLPDELTQVSGDIEAAANSIGLIKAGIPDFVSKATSALTQASSELNQAGGLCDQAIAICTKYMMKAPLLIPARLLFVGIKASIPALQASLSAAGTTVTQAGAAAGACLDQAIAAVHAIDPLLAQAVAQIRSAVGVVVNLVSTLQLGLVSAQTGLKANVATLSTMTSTLSARLDALMTSARSQAATRIATLAPASALAPLKQQLTSVQSKASGAAGTAATAQGTSSTKVTDIDPVDASPSLTTLSERVNAVPGSVRQAADDLKAIYAQCLSVLGELRATELERTNTLTTQIGLLMDEATVRAGLIRAAAGSGAGVA
jgi:hypothetical protein